MTGLVASLLLIAVAEMGDKTQLLALSLASRYQALKVLLGITIATLFVFLFSTFVGQAVSRFIPMRHLQIIVGLAFVAFGIWTLIGNSFLEKESKNGERSVVITVAVAFFIAELGDKTQLATVSLAAKYRSFMGVWLGSTLGMVIADSIAIGVGNVAGKKLPEKIISYISAGIFIGFGMIAIVETLI